MKWFRLWSDILDDVKMFQLSDYEFRMWIFLLSYCSEVNAESGQCQTKVNSMSIRFRTQVNHLSRAFETFQKLGLITITDEGFIAITNWNKRQFKSDNAYDRVKKYRQSQPEMKRFKGVTRNVSETAPDTDTDTDKRKVIKERKALLSDTQWILSLKNNTAYTGIDVDREYGKCLAWCEANNKVTSRRRFVNWLNRTEKPIGGSNGPTKPLEGNRIPEYKGTEIPCESPTERERGRQVLRRIRESIEKGTAKV